MDPPVPCMLPTPSKPTPTCKLFAFCIGPDVRMSGVDVNKKQFLIVFLLLMIILFDGCVVDDDENEEEEEEEGRGDDNDCANFGVIKMWSRTMYNLRMPDNDGGSDNGLHTLIFSSLFDTMTIDADDDDDKNDKEGA